MRRIIPPIQIAFSYFFLSHQNGRVVHLHQLSPYLSLSDNIRTAPNLDPGKLARSLYLIRRVAWTVVEKPVRAVRLGEVSVVSGIDEGSRVADGRERYPLES